MPRMPNLGFISPMLGKHAGYIPTQGQILSEHFSYSGYTVLAASSARMRVLRLLDISQLIIQQHKRIDLLIVDVYGELSFISEAIASWLASRLGLKLVLHLHNGTLPSFIERFPSWTKSVFQLADAIVTPSPFLARTIKPYGFQAHVIPNVIDLESYPFRNRQQIQPRLLWMRAFYPYYNPLMAIKSLSRILKEYPEAQLVMAGKDKGMQQEVQAYTRSINISDHVRFPGFLDMEGKIHEGNAADIFLNTNHVDNMPVGVIEACALGLPVISTNVGGIPDMLQDHQTGLLVPDNDDGAMAVAIFALLKDPKLTSRLSRNGRQFAERSSWTQVRFQWEKLFEILMEA